MNKLLHAEIIKHKGSLALWFVFLGPFIIVLLMGIQTLMWGAGFIDGLSPARFFIRNNLTLWSFLMLPFFITLITSMSAHLEHKNKMWNVLLTAGVPRPTLLCVKLVFAVLLVWFSFALWILMLLAGGQALSLAMPAFGAWSGADTWYAVSRITKMALVSVPMVLIHFWVANRFRNILVSFGFGVVVTILNFMVSSSRVNWLFPWSLPLLMAQPKSGAELINVFAFAAIFSIAAGAALVIDLSKKEY